MWLKQDWCKGILHSQAELGEVTIKVVKKIVIIFFGCRSGIKIYDEQNVSLIVSAVNIWNSSFYINHQWIFRPTLLLERK